MFRFPFSVTTARERYGYGMWPCTVALQMLAMVGKAQSALNYIRGPESERYGDVPDAGPRRSHSLKLELPFLRQNYTSIDPR